MAIDFSIFRANDIRGVADSSLSVGVAEQIGRALAAVAVERGFARIALGRDGRESSPRLSAAVAAGLVAGGMRVFDIGVNPTPAVYYAAATRADGCGAVVTGSHNPKNYNGVKMMLGNETLSGDAAADLAARIRDGFAPSARVGGCEPIDIAPAYLAELRANIRLARPLKIVVDAGNGATGDFAPKMLRALGCEVDELFCEIDGAFPNHHPDPARPENLRAAANRRRELGADAAFVFDGDGDRLGRDFAGIGRRRRRPLADAFRARLLARRGRAGGCFRCQMHAPSRPLDRRLRRHRAHAPDRTRFYQARDGRTRRRVRRRDERAFLFPRQMARLRRRDFRRRALGRDSRARSERRRRFAGEPGLARNQYRFAGRRNPARIDAQNRGFGGYRAAARIVSARNQNKRDRRLANRIRRRLRLGCALRIQRRAWSCASKATAKTRCARFNPNSAPRWPPSIRGSRRRFSRAAAPARPSADDRRRGRIYECGALDAVSAF